MSKNTLAHRWLRNVGWFVADANRALAVLTLALVVIGIGALCIARDQEQRQLRAYAYVKPPPLGIEGVSVGKAPYATIAVRNSGQTPAYDLRLRGNTGFGPYPLPPDQTFREGPYGGAIVVNPDTETTTGGRVFQLDEKENAVKPGDPESILDGKSRRLYLFGTIVYKDAFGTERTSNYCFAYFGPSPTLTAMDYCDRHNEQD